MDSEAQKKLLKQVQSPAVFSIATESLPPKKSESILEQKTPEGSNEKDTNMSAGDPISIHLSNQMD